MIDPGLQIRIHAIATPADTLYYFIAYQAASVPVLPNPARQ